VGERIETRFGERLNPLIGVIPEKYGGSHAAGSVENKSGILNPEGGLRVWF
jgi:hypothetical protein